MNNPIIGCVVCQIEQDENDHVNRHYICVICGMSIHTTQSSHRDGNGARHERCEQKSANGKTKKG